MLQKLLIHACVWCYDTAMAGGRPTTYTPELGRRICEGVARGVPIADICDSSEDMPAVSTVYYWKSKNSEFSELYESARKDSAVYMADQILKIADEDPPEHSAWTRNRIDARKWLATKYLPKVYGDSVLQKHANSEGEKLEISIKIQDEALIAAALERIQNRSKPLGGGGS